MNNTKLPFNLNFSLLCLATTISMVGDSFYDLAIGFLILSTTGSSTKMGTLMAISILCRVLFSPIAGSVIDRNNKKNILIITDLFRGIFILMLAVLTFYGKLELYHIVSISIIIGICGAFFFPTASSFITELVPKDELVKSN